MTLKMIPLFLLFFSQILNVLISLLLLISFLPNKSSLSL